MKISTKRLMEIIEEYKKENSEDYDNCEMDLFDDEEWDEIEECINSGDYVNDEKYVTEKTRRVNIFVNAIKTKNGKKYVETELERVKLKKIYVRNFHELILYWCLKNNDENADYKVGPEEYARIKKECNLFREKQRELIGKYDENNSFSGKITLRKIREYLVDNSKMSDEQELLTRSITFNMKKDIDEINLSGYNEKQLVETIIGHAGEKTKLINFTEKCEKTRYYFVKYLSYLIEYHILEFIDLLNEFADTTIDKIQSNLYNDSYGSSNYLPWSVKYNVLEAVRTADKEKNIFGDKDHADERIMQIVSQVVCFEGTPLREDNVSYMFKSIKGELKSFSDIRDIGYIFPKKNEEVIGNSKHDAYMRDHELLKEEIKKLTVETFIDFPIKLSRLAALLFERSAGVDALEEESISNLKTKFANMLQGSVEISRDTLLFFLMVLDQILKDKPELLSKRIMITVDRVNDVLNKCGFEMMMGKYIMDYIVKDTLNMSNGEFVDSIYPFFYDVREKEGNDAMLNIDNEKLTTYGPKIDKQLFKIK